MHAKMSPLCALSVPPAVPAVALRQRHQDLPEPLDCPGTHAMTNVPPGHEDDITMLIWDACTPPKGRLPRQYNPGGPGHSVALYNLHSRRSVDAL